MKNTLLRIVMALFLAVGLTSTVCFSGCGGTSSTPIGTDVAEPEAEETEEFTEGEAAIGGEGEEEEEGGGGEGEQ